MGTLSCPEAPPCTPVLLTECRRRSPPSLPPPSRSRLSLPLRGSTLSGSEDPSWPPSPPSSRCGSPSRSTTSPAPALSTGSASKLTHNNNNNNSFPTTTTTTTARHNRKTLEEEGVARLIRKLHHFPNKMYSVVLSICDIILLFSLSCTLNVNKSYI